MLTPHPLRCAERLPSGRSESDAAELSPARCCRGVTFLYPYRASRAEEPAPLDLGGLLPRAYAEASDGTRAVVPPHRMPRALRRNDRRRSTPVLHPY